MDFRRIKCVSIHDRLSKVHVKNFAQPVEPDQWLAHLDKALPKILAGSDFQQVVDRILRAVRLRKPVVFLLGAHVIKCGLSAVIVDLMGRGVITAVALNGAGAIHDTEVALWGQTSEDVDRALAESTFGMTRETAHVINAALAQARRGEGFGRCLGRRLSQLDPPHADVSILLAGYRLALPVTVHVAIGTDVIHQHPSTDGAIVGRLSYRDFKILARCLSNIGGGGVVVNFGSAVILPEIFLKGLSLARNLRGDIRGYTTVDCDMIRHYRPTVNLVRRPGRAGGHGYQLIGHHEIMIPLLAAAIRQGLKPQVGRRSPSI